MIHIYPPSFTDFSINGVVLMPSSCMLSMEINGVWTIQLENSLDVRFQNIVENAIISVPTPYGQARFRITGIDKSNTGISATAVPVFLDASNDTFIYDQRPTNRTGQQALDILTANTKYTGHSDITTPNTAYYQMKNLIECISSDDDNSFLNRWGGEIRYHNYDIYINKRLGADNGARVEFGFNLSSVNESIDMTNVVTSIVPVSYNGYTLPDGETVDSSNINKYPTKYIRKIEFNDIKLKEDAQENDEENGVIVCETLEELYSELRKAAAQKFQEGIDLPSITYQVDMVDLSRTQEYEKFKDLVKVNLGDTVYVKHRRLNIETKARIIALEYDCITEKINHLTIGDYVQNYFDKTSDITSSVDKVIDKNNDTLMADKIAGVINLLNTSLRAQKDIAQKQDVRAILFEDLDTNSPTFGALCIGTQGIQISKKRNPEDTDWVWGTAINFESIVANYIIAGILSDKLGNNSWNLDTGELKTKNMVAENGTFTGRITGSQITGGTVNGTTITTDKDLNVGNNIYLNYKDETSTKSIFLGKELELRFVKNNGVGYFYIIAKDQNGRDLSISFSGGNGILHPGVTINATNNSGKNSTYTFEGGMFMCNGILNVDNNVSITGDLTVRGEKNRVVKTSKGMVRMHAIESTYAVFEDFGSAMTDKDGMCMIMLDQLFLETVNTECDYYVFLSPRKITSVPHICVQKKYKDSFCVHGDPNTKFDWIVIAKQRGYEDVRMEVYKDDNIN